MEVVVPSLRVSKQNGLNPQEYSGAMMMELEALDRKRLQASKQILDPQFCPSTLAFILWVSHSPIVLI